MFFVIIFLLVGLYARPRQTVFVHSPETCTCIATFFSSSFHGGVGVGGGGRASPELIYLDPKEFTEF